MAADVESGVEMRTCEREVAFSIMRSAAAALLCLLSSAEPKVAAAEPKVALIRTLWGVDRFDVQSEWKQLFQDLAAKNYSGVEAPTWVVCGLGPTFDEAHECDASRARGFRDALKASGLFYIAQLHTSGYPISSSTVDDHLASLRALLRLAKQELGADFANVHGGVDWWSPEQMVTFFVGAKRIQEEEGDSVPATVSRSITSGSCCSSADGLPIL